MYVDKKRYYKYTPRKRKDWKKNTLPVNVGDEEYNHWNGIASWTMIQGLRGFYWETEIENRKKKSKSCGA